MAFINEKKTQNLTFAVCYKTRNLTTVEWIQVYYRGSFWMFGENQAWFEQLILSSYKSAYDHHCHLYKKHALVTIYASSLLITTNSTSSLTCLSSVWRKKLSKERFLIFLMFSLALQEKICQLVSSLLPLPSYMFYVLFVVNVIITYEILDVLFTSLNRQHMYNISKHSSWLWENMSKL